MFDGFGDDKVNEAPGNEDGNGTSILHHFTQVQKTLSGNLRESNLAMRNP
jgi:hypothetical protein